MFQNILRKVYRFSLLGTMFLVSGLLEAQVPSSLGHQGRIMVNNQNFDGVGQFKFLLYRGESPSDTDTLVWANDNASPAVVEPAGSLSLPVTKGLYSVVLGDSPMPALTGDIIPEYDEQFLYLRIWFNDGVNGFQHLGPDRKITSVPFALSSLAAGGVDPGNGSGDSPTTQSGTVTLMADDTGVSGGVFEVTFSAPFDAPPIVTPNVLASVSGITGGASVQVTSVSATGFTGVVNLDPLVSLADTVVEGEGIYDGFELGRYIAADSANGVMGVALNQADDALHVRTSSDGGESWGIETVYSPFGSSTASIFSYTDLAIVAGEPATIFREQRAGQVALVYVHRNNGFTGHGDTFDVEVATSSLTGTYRDIAIADIGGAPGIVFESPVDGLVYLRGNSSPGFTPAGGADFASPVILTSNSVSQVSLWEVNGRPAVSYFDLATLTYKFNRANDATGTSWGAGIDLGLFLIVPNSELRVVDGFPAIFTGRHMIRATDVDGTAFAAPLEVVPPLFTVSSEIDVTFIDGRPAVSFFDVSKGGLYVAQALDVAGSQWQAPVRVADIDVNEDYQAIGVSGTSPVVVAPRGVVDDSRQVVAYRAVEPSITVNWIAVSP